MASVAKSVEIGAKASASTGSGKASPRDRPGRFLLLFVCLTIAGIGAINLLNKLFAPEMYLSRGTVPIANALALGHNYAVFDLNFNIREFRDAHIARLPRAPDVAVLGASHWQEAHEGLAPGVLFYNAHVHRDYYEDMLGVAEILVRHDRLPPTLVISIRDNLFRPLEERRDHLWLPGIPYYRAMARRLELPAHGNWATLPVARWREQISMSMLIGNVQRWFLAEKRPHETGERELDQLDILLPDGSIVWSRAHRRLFTQERARKVSLEMAEQSRNAPPSIDRAGVAALDKLLAFLKSRGTRVVLAHPPFNPTFYDAVRDTPYMKGLRRVDAVTRGLAETHGLEIIGSFDPVEVGCTKDMFIDGEHANPQCLGKVLAQLHLPAPTAASALVASGSLMPGQGANALRLVGLSEYARPAHPAQLAMIAASQSGLGIVMAAEVPPADPLLAGVSDAAQPAHPAQAVMISLLLPTAPVAATGRNPDADPAAPASKTTRRPLRTATEAPVRSRVALVRAPLEPATLNFPGDQASARAVRPIHPCRELIWPGDAPPPACRTGRRIAGARVASR